jgi:acyl-CoA reductase-like NAD-dependent aldehyde dehydrogenase
VDRAVEAARAAFESGPWPQITAPDRGRILSKLAEKVRQNSAMLAELESRNTGKPISRQRSAFLAPISSELQTFILSGMQLNDGKGDLFPTSFQAVEIDYFRG